MECNIEVNVRYPKFEVSNHLKKFSIRLHSKLVWRVFMIKKIKNILLWTNVIEDLYGKETNR